MADWSDPTPFQLQAMHEALLFAFPSHLDLDNLLVLRLGKSYAALAPVLANYSQGVTAILQQARAESWLNDLVCQALRAKPRSPKLLLLDRSAELARVDLPLALGAGLEHIVREAQACRT